MADEESPGRVEFVDETQQPPLTPFGAAYRPQESLGPHYIEAMVRQARNTVSPITHEQLDLALLTGDNADSQQYNETRWFIDILDGQKKIDPNSGREGICDPTPNALYDGVRNGGREQGYYEPDASEGGEDGRGYTPDRAENFATTGRDVTVRDFPGLFEAAQHRFEAIGLDMPWYSAFGNHDALVQGNSPSAYFGPEGPSGETSNPAYQGIATGCLKPSKLPGGSGSLFDAFGDPGQIPGTAPLTVPPDERRCYLAKDEPPPAGGAPAPCSSGGWIQQHFLSTGQPAGHGFANRPPTAVVNNDGYYAFTPRQGLRFAVLDSVTDDCGSEVPLCSEGSIDHTQFEWLRGEIEAAAARGDYVITFAHHTLRTTRSPNGDPTEEPVHYGEAVDRRDGQPQPPSPGETLEQLFCENPNVLAHVAGHEHQNFVERHECEQDQPPTPGAGDFWEVSTASHIDWPQQSRMIELIDNAGTDMSLAVTMLDHDGPPDPGNAPAFPIARGASGEQVLKLASIGREIAYNDYQGSRGAIGASVSDRNAILPLEQPWPYGSE